MYRKILKPTGPVPTTPMSDIIDYYHLVADLAIKGDITAKDLRWYAVEHRSNKFLDLVARRYGEPQVAQLVDKKKQMRIGF